MVDMIKIKADDGFQGVIKGTKEEIIQKGNLHRALREIRGNLIESTIIIEQELNLLVSNILFRGHKNRTSGKPHEIKGEIQFFEDFILNSSHITFGSKIKLFRSLCKTYSFFKDKDLSNIATNLKKVAEWRDRFAHGDIYFKTYGERLSDHPYLFYYHDAKQKEQTLNEEFFVEIINPLIQETYTQLNVLRKDVNEKMDKEIGQFFF
ncbi:MAG: hypothetical protein HY831_02255 [Candidatus Aenigmarchaeota archaeon]|nr:hypothetical protein [Candidatus Aenigmarchaeota archaeon]